MENTSHYAFEDDGRLWTLFNGGQKRPSTAEKMEGFCLERKTAFHPALSALRTDEESVPYAMAV